MSTIIAPSGPPRKRGSAGSVYRFAGRRSNTQTILTRNLKQEKQDQLPKQITYTPRVISENPLKVHFNNPKSEKYQELLEVEEELDSQIQKAKARVQRVMGKQPKSLKGVLRLHIYNTTSQSEDRTVWNLRIQGRLIHPNMKTLYNKEQLPQGYTRKFSSFFKKIEVVFPSGEKVEWLKAKMPRETDGIELKRVGNVEEQLRVLLYVDHIPAKFNMSSELSEFMGAKEESQENIIRALWFYIKKYRLQDPDERKFINNDEALYKIFKEERTELSSIFSKIRKHLSEAQPVELIHNLKLTPNWTETEHIYDIAVELEDPIQLELVNFFMEQKTSPIFSENCLTNSVRYLRAEPSMEIPKNPLEEEINEINTQMQSLKKDLLKHVNRRAFAMEFMQNPKESIEQVLADQERCLQVLRTPSKYDEINQDVSTDTQSSEFYKNSWTKDLVERYIELNK